MGRSVSVETERRRGFGRVPFDSPNVATVKCIHRHVQLYVGISAPLDVSAPSFDPASSGNGHVESLGRAIDDQMERASIRAACAFSDGDQLSMSSIGGWLSPRAPRNRTRRGTNIVAEVQSPKTRSRRCCETMIFVLSSFIRLSEPTFSRHVTGQCTSRTRLRVSCPPSRTSEHSSAGATGCDVRMFGCLPLDGPHREGGLLAGLRTY
jgi:hypothetical protein